MSGLFGGKSGGGLAGGLGGGVKMAAVGLLIHQLMKHSQSGVLGGFNHLALVYGSKAGSGGEWLPTYAGGGSSSGSSSTSPVATSRRRRLTRSARTPAKGARKRSGARCDVLGGRDTDDGMRRTEGLREQRRRELRQA